MATTLEAGLCCCSVPLLVDGTIVGVVMGKEEVDVAPMVVGTFPINERMSRGPESTVAVEGDTATVTAVVVVVVLRTNEDAFTWRNRGKSIDRK